MGELGRNCNIGKYRHFRAADRAKLLNDSLGVIVVLINIVVGSAFFIAISKQLPPIAQWIGGFLALGAALTSGVTTFFSFDSLFEQHRDIADKYVKLLAKCEISLARYHDGLVDLGGIDQLLQEYQERYSEISDEAKEFPTSRSDFANALKREADRSKRFHSRQPAAL
jgi:hypothetical protein